MLVWRTIRNAYALLSLLTQATYGTQLCGMLNHRAAIVGNQLYLQGDTTFDDGIPRQSSKWLYSIDLSKQIDVNGPVDLEFFNRSLLPGKERALQLSSVAETNGTFFYDQITLYVYAATLGDANTDQLWTYNTTTGLWNVSTVQGGKYNFGGNGEGGVSATDPYSARSFYTGGSIVAYDDKNVGLLAFDSSTSASPWWSFETSIKGAFPGPNILLGIMVYLRMGQAGVLLAFGGYNTSHLAFKQSSESVYLPMNEIFVYDIFSSTWYQILATGDIPSNRSAFCAGVSAAPDDSSFQVTIHGGYVHNSSTSLSDVYVLSIPSFQWIAVQTTNNPDRGAGRHGHRCDMWQDGQMIISGGEENDNLCNKSYPLFKVLDTSTYSWKAQFNPDAKYNVPGVVTAKIGGNGSGGATVHQPFNGWSTDLSMIFSKTVPRNKSIVTNTTSNSKPEDVGSVDLGTNQNAVIAGSAVGGAAAMAIIEVAVWLFWRSYRQRRKMQHEAHHENQRTRRLSISAVEYDPYTIEYPHVARELYGVKDTRELSGRDARIETVATQAPCELEVPLFEMDARGLLRYRTSARRQTI